MLSTSEDQGDPINQSHPYQPNRSLLHPSNLRCRRFILPEAFLSYLILSLSPTSHLNYHHTCFSKTPKINVVRPLFPQHRSRRPVAQVRNKANLSVSLDKSHGPIDPLLIKKIFTSLFLYIRGIVYSLSASRRDTRLDDDMYMETRHCHLI